MSQTGLVVKANTKVVATAIFAGNIVEGMQTYKEHIETLNPEATFVYEEYDDTAVEFTSAVIDEAEAQNYLFVD